jgi:hypothetical protein
VDAFSLLPANQTVAFARMSRSIWKTQTVIVGGGAKTADFRF